MLALGLLGTAPGQVVLVGFFVGLVGFLVGWFFVFLIFIYK